MTCLCLLTVEIREFLNVVKWEVPYYPDLAPKHFNLLCHCHQAFEPLDSADEIVRDIPVYLVSSQSATWLLGPGQHNIRHVFYMSR